MQTAPLATSTAPARAVGRALPDTRGDVIIIDASEDGNNDEGGDPESHLVDELETLFGDNKPKKTNKAAPKGGPNDGADEDEDAEDPDADAEDAPDTTPAEDDDDEGLTPPENEADKEDEEDEDEDADAEKEEEKLQLPEKFRKRLDKITAQRETARKERDTFKSEAETLKKQVESFEAEPVLLSPGPEHPLSNTRTAAEVDASEEHWQKVRDWCEENDDGGTFEAPNGTKTDLDKKQVRKLLKSAETMLEKHVPERRAFLASRAKHAPETKKAYPFLLNPDHPGAKFAVELVKGTKLALRADYELTAGDAYVGRLIRRGLANAVLDSKTGEVKLMRQGKKKSGTSSSSSLPKPKPPGRVEAAGPTVRPAGKEGRAGGVSAALSRGDGEAALEALYGG